MISIQNPLSDDYTVMRPTTISSMMQMLTNNYNKKNQDVSLYDISRRYRNEKENIEKGELPREDIMLTIGAYGKKADFYILKGLIENLLQNVGMNRYDIIRVEDNPSYHPGRTAAFKVGNDVFATFGEVHPQVLANYGIEQRAVLAEIDLQKVAKYARQNKKV